MVSLFGSKSPRNFKKNKSRHQNDASIKNIFLNSLIFVLTVCIGVFIYSFSTKQVHNGKPFEIIFPPTTDPPPLHTVFEKNPISESPVEVLNGCGIQGMAAQFTRFLRNNNIDVLNSDDADHYNYTHTLIISRKGNIKILKEVSSLLEIDIKDKNHVLNNPVSDSDVDLTVIIGSDYTSIKPVMEFLNNQN